MPVVKVTPDIWAAIVEKLKETPRIKHHDIAKAFGLGVGTVRRIAKIEGIRFRVSAVTAAQVKRLCAMFDQDMLLKDIAEAEKLCVYTVSRHLRAKERRRYRART